MREKGSLSPRQKRFIAEYVIDLNATRAAIKAGYSVRGAESQGSHLLRIPKVTDEIARRTEARAKKLDVNAQNVLAGIATLATFDPRKFFDSQGRLKPIHEIDDATVPALAGVEVKELYDRKGNPEGTVTKIKFCDRGVNLERLGRHLALFTDKVQSEVNVNIQTLSDDDLRARLEQLRQADQEPKP